MGDLQKELLKWSIENTVTDEVKEEPVKFRRPQDIGKEWYDAIFGRPDVVVMKECLEILKDTEKSVEDRLEALEQLSFYVELTHNANDLVKIKGLSTLFSQLSHENAEIRLETCWIIAKCASNNPEFQESCLEQTETFQKLLQMTQDDIDDNVKIKALHAVAALARHYPRGIDVLIELMGLDVLLKLCRSEDIKMIRKSVFFLKYLVWAEKGESLGKEIPFQLLNLGFIDTLESIFQCNDFEVLENALGIVLELDQYASRLVPLVPFIEKIDRSDSEMSDLVNAVLCLLR